MNCGATRDPLPGWFPRFCWAWWACAVLFGLMGNPAPASAHLVAAQKGTLNIVGEGAFLVLSVPVSALKGVDDDADGALSKAELQAHAPSIQAQVVAGVQLLGPRGALPLQLVMMDTEAADQTHPASAKHLTVLGRFELGGGHREVASTTVASESLSLLFTLFGTGEGERQQDLTITRQQESQWLRFTPERRTHAVLPSTWSVLAEYAGTGARHVLEGADHLLFLMVVLSAALGWRALLGALTCFTAGHALTLAACVWGGWSVPERIVEPAIAATIVGMATFDAWGRWRARPAPLGLQLALVLACSMVHGLGLAGALSDLTQWPAGSDALLGALVGFNLGIELAQVGVAAVALALSSGVHRFMGHGVHRRAGQVTALGAIVMGSVWLAERLS